MFIYYYDSNFHKFFTEQDSMNLVSNHKSDYTDGEAYRLTDEEVAFKLKYPKATIENIFSQSVPREYTEELRQAAYTAESDSLFIAWQKYLAQDKESQALAMKQAWLDKVAEIEARYPYFE